MRRSCGSAFPRKECRVRDKSKQPCSFPGCANPRRKIGLCASHYSQKRAGNELRPIHLKQRPFGSPPRIAYDEVPCPRSDLNGPCQIFCGVKNKDGYGQVRLDGKMVQVHRYVWELAHGPIPAGLVIDHQCRNRACCNVDHLRVVTRMVNAKENVIGSALQIMAAKTHCKRGHPFDEANTRRDPKTNARSCRTCLRERGRQKRTTKNDAVVWVAVSK